ncbi:MAG: Zn-dependent alcohol dehydrogenase, partial [Alphaproteobacteria bacterium]
MTANSISAAFHRGNHSFAVEPTTARRPGPGEVAIRVAYC